MLLLVVGAGSIGRRHCRNLAALGHEVLVWDVEPARLREVEYLRWSDEVDYVSNVMPPTYPDGLDTGVSSRAALECAWREARLDSEREPVTTQQGGARLGNRIEMTGRRSTEAAMARRGTMSASVWKSRRPGVAIRTGW